MDTVNVINAEDLFSESNVGLVQFNCGLITIRGSEMVLM